MAAPTDDHDEKYIDIDINIDIEHLISIDFGSFGSIASTCLPSTPSDYKIAKMRSSASFIQKKELTALLWDTNRHRVVAFGYEAQRLYIEYSKAQTCKKDSKRKTDLLKHFEDEHVKLALFKHFKPHLVGDNPLRKDAMIWSTDWSAQLSLFDLVTYSLMELKRNAMAQVQQLRIDGMFDLDEKAVLQDNQIMWALSTPSVWDDTSRAAYEECAKRAGLVHYEIGIEPEFALFCMSKEDKADFLSSDMTCVILDCGGGTVDATCVELVGSGASMSEALPRKGIDTGSLSIDNAYYNMLRDVFGIKSIELFCQQQPHHWLALETSFWKLKHAIDPSTLAGARVCLDIPNTFWTFLRKRFKATPAAEHLSFTEHVQRLLAEYCRSTFGSHQAQCIVYDDDDGSLQIGKIVWQAFHKKVIEEIIDLLAGILSDSNMSECHNVILVGGFSQSKFLQQALVARFANGIDDYDKREIKINFAAKPVLSVVIGGLFWAYNRRNFGRKMWSTYGFEVSRIWKRGVDSDDNKHRDNNSPTQYIKKHVFDAIIYKNDPFDELDEIKREYIIPCEAGTLTLKLYAVDDERGVDYVTDVGCHVAADYHLKLKEEKWMKLTQQKLRVTIELKQTMLNIFVMKPDHRQHKMTVRNPRLS